VSKARSRPAMGESRISRASSTVLFLLPSEGREGQRHSLRGEGRERREPGARNPPDAAILERRGRR
jgi:hypothetical protein